MRNEVGAGRRWLATALVAAQLVGVGPSRPAWALTASPPSAGGTAPPAASDPGPRAMPGAEPGRIVRCESDGSFRRCPADTSAGVALARELSTGRCVARSTWGFDGAGIWVDKGCRGEFRVAGAAPDTAPAPTDDPAARAEDRAAASGSGIDGSTALLILGAIVAGGAAAALLSGDENDKNRKRQAVALCERRLDREVRDRGGRGGKILRIERARERGKKLELEAVARADWRRGDTSRGTIDCRVDFAGGKETVAFRQSGLWRGGRR